MSLKILFFDSHVKFFPSDCGKFIDQHGERFHQTIKNVEDRYRGRCDERMLADFVGLWKFKHLDFLSFPMQLFYLNTFVNMVLYVFFNRKYD